MPKLYQDRVQQVWETAATSGETLPPAGERVQTVVTKSTSDDPQDISDELLCLENCLFRPFDVIVNMCRC